MEPYVIIDGYVSDVVSRLPRRQRGDVGVELRSLLREELEGRAADTGRPADESTAMELLAAFGRPQDVADRYRPAGFTVIRPADAPRFAAVALGGVALQWAVTLPAVLTGAAGVQESVVAAGGSPDGLTLFSVWWLSWGLGSFWWPGFLISVTLIAGIVRHLRTARTAQTAGTGPEPAPVSTPIPRSVLDRDRVHRPGLVVGLGFAALGATVVIALPWLPALAPALPRPVLDAFAFDPDFLRWRAPVVLLLWAATFALEFAVLVAGRTRRLTRRISIAICVCWLALLTWWLVAGPIFRSPDADGVTRGCLVVVAAIVVVQLVVAIRREAMSTGASAAERAWTAPRR